MEKKQKKNEIKPTYNYNYGITVLEPKERINHMSYSCIYMSENEIILGADSRETYVNGKVNDDYQKVFMNDEQNLIWSITGLYKYNDIDYSKLVCDILNMNALLVNKLEAIQNIMKYPTKKFYESVYKDGIFDLLIGTLENSQLAVYTCEVKNGKINFDECKKYNELICPIFSGVKFNFKKKMFIEKLIEEKDINLKINEMEKLIQQAINADTTGTIGGKPNVVVLTKDGQINKNFI